MHGIRKKIHTDSPSGGSCSAGRNFLKNFLTFQIIAAAVWSADSAADLFIREYKNRAATESKLSVTALFSFLAMFAVNCLTDWKLSNDYLVPKKS